jgi:signal transduction histidine kinase
VGLPINWPLPWALVATIAAAITGGIRCGLLVGAAIAITVWAGHRRAQALLRKEREEMASRVLERTKELEEANNSLQAEITARKLIRGSLESRAAELSRSQDSLRKQTGILQSILRSMGDGVIVIDEHSRVLVSNPAAGRILGTPFPVENLPFERALHGETRWGEEILLEHRQTGERVWTEATAAPLRDPDGNVLGGVLVIRDISDRKQAQQELEQRNVELARSNQELDDFAYIASHDLKEPLRGIHNYAQFLIEDYGHLLDEEGRMKCRTLVRLSQRMDALIETLLQFSRLGRVDLAFGGTDLDQVVREVADSLAIGIRERGVEVLIPKPLPAIQCDAARIGEVFRNLISNSLKYNDSPRPWIEIGWSGCDENVCLQPPVFYVSDNGIGIPERHREAVFRMFKRLHARDKYGGGTGAGLTIVKKIVERHGGRIWLESKVGEGTRFSFTLQPGSPCLLHTVGAA